LRTNAQNSDYFTWYFADDSFKPDDASLKKKTIPQAEIGQRDYDVLQ
jgi:hypothetical protein